MGLFAAITAAGGLAQGVRNLFSGEARERRQARRAERQAGREIRREERAAARSPEADAILGDIAGGSAAEAPPKQEKGFLEKYGLWLGLGALVLLSGNFLKPKRRAPRRRSPAKPKVVYRTRRAPARRRRR